MACLSHLRDKRLLGILSASSWHKAGKPAIRDGCFVVQTYQANGRACSRHLSVQHYVRSMLCDSIVLGPAWQLSMSWIVYIPRHDRTYTFTMEKYYSRASPYSDEMESNPLTMKAIVTRGRIQFDPKTSGRPRSNKCPILALALGQEHSVRLLPKYCKLRQAAMRPSRLLRSPAAVPLRFRYRKSRSVSGPSPALNRFTVGKNILFALFP